MDVTAQAAIGLSALVVAVAGSVSAAPVASEKVACSLVKQRVAAARHIPVWANEFCDIIPESKSPPGVYVIGLHHPRSKEDCPEICSTLMGWFAVRKGTGEVGEFDINEWKMTPLEFWAR